MHTSASSKLECDGEPKKLACEGKCGGLAFVAVPPSVQVFARSSAAVRGYTHSSLGLVQLYRSSKNVYA